MKIGGVFLADHIIANDWQSAEETLDAYISSINGDSSIIWYGHPEHQKAWFILDLSVKVFNKTYDNNFMFPYEILTWLKIRELKGLKNPTEFSHPFMNTPIAKMFLDIKEPLLKRKELPFAKELLEKLKEKSPNVEIPEWLDII